MNWDSSRIVYLARVTNLRHGCKFVATNDDSVWVDTKDEKSIDAAFYGKEDMSKTIPYDYVQHINWTPVEIISGFYARKKKDKSESMIGNTPFEAVSYLQFDDKYEIDRPNVTESSTMKEQIFDILRYHTGSVHIQTLQNYLNYNNLDSDIYTQDEIKNKLIELEDKTPVYKTKEGDLWWSIR